MCWPVAIPFIMMGVSALAGAGMAAVKINQQNKVASAEMEAATNAARNDFMILQEKEQQVHQQEADEATARMNAAQIERAKMRAAFGETNMVGNTALHLLATSFVSESWDIGVMQANERNKMLQIKAEKDKVFSDEMSRINAAKAKITSSDMAALQIAMAGFGGAMSSYSKSNAPASTTSLSGLDNSTVSAPETWSYGGGE